jgi:hypothetical protein
VANKNTFFGTIHSKFGKSSATLNSTARQRTYLRVTDYAPKINWKNQSKDPSYFNYSEALNDGTHTPRSRAKAISISRNHEKRRWVPPRNHMEELRFREKKRYVM